MGVDRLGIHQRRRSDSFGYDTSDVVAVGSSYSFGCCIWILVETDCLVLTACDCRALSRRLLELWDGVQAATVKVVPHSYKRAFATDCV